MTKNILAILISSLLSVPSPALTQSGKAMVDLAKAKTEVEFVAIGNPSALKIHGKAKEESGKKPVNGELSLTNGNMTGKVHCALDSFDTGISMRNRHMKEKYLETPKFPDASFTLTDLKIPGGAKAADFSEKSVPFKGLMTLHGVTKPISGEADVERHGQSLTGTFSFKLNIADFGITTPTFMGITMTKEVTVNVNVEGPVS